MTIIYILIPVSIVLVGLAAGAVFWAVGAGQFDDLESPAWDVLQEDTNEQGHVDERARR